MRLYDNMTIAVNGEEESFMLKTLIDEYVTVVEELIFSGMIDLDRQALDYFEGVIDEYYIQSAIDMESEGDF